MPPRHCCYRCYPRRFSRLTTPLLSDRYDSHLLPGGQKRGLLIGMGMTEKQVPDVMSNTTRAERLEVWLLSAGGA
ncbi:hypothetical protein ACLK14_23490 [Escherichia coli]